MERALENNDNEYHERVYYHENFEKKIEKNYEARLGMF